MTLSNYPPGVTGNEPQITGISNYPGSLPSKAEVDSMDLPDLRKLADRVMDEVGDDIEEIAMNLAGNMPSFDPDMIDYNDFLEGPLDRLMDRLWGELASHLVPAGEPRGFTPRTDDIHEWMKSSYFDYRYLIVTHTEECDHQSAGDECIGGCKVMTS